MKLIKKVTKFEGVIEHTINNVVYYALDDVLTHLNITAITVEEALKGHATITASPFTPSLDSMAVNVKNTNIVAKEMPEKVRKPYFYYCLNDKGIVKSSAITENTGMTGKLVKVENFLTDKDKHKVYMCFETKDTINILAAWVYSENMQEIVAMLDSYDKDYNHDIQVVEGKAMVNGKTINLVGQQVGDDTANLLVHFESLGDAGKLASSNAEFLPRANRDKFYAAPFKLKQESF